MTDATLTAIAVDTAPAKKAARLVHIDGARGYLLLAMFVAHFNFTHWTPIIYLHHGGYTPVWDGEFFVLLSGFVCALSYGSVFQRTGFFGCFKAVIKRLRWVYLYHVIVAFTMLHFFIQAWPLQLDSLYKPDLETPLLIQSLQVFTFVKQPIYLGILLLYIVLMLFIPVAAWLLDRGKTFLFFGIIIVCWLAARLNIDAIAGAWFEQNIIDTSGMFALRSSFSPLSYALLFYGGYYLGYRYKRYGWDDFRQNILPLNYSWFFVAVAAIATFAVAELFREQLNSPTWLYEPNRAEISITGIMGTCAVSYAVYFLLNRKDLPFGLSIIQSIGEKILLHPLLVTVGQSSLFVYSAHVFAVFLPSYFIVATGHQGDRGVIVVVFFTALLALIGLAFVKRRYFPALP